MASLAQPVSAALPGAETYQTKGFQPLQRWPFNPVTLEPSQNLAVHAVKRVAQFALNSVANLFIAAANVLKLTVGNVGAFGLYSAQRVWSYVRPSAEQPAQAAEEAVEPSRLSQVKDWMWENQVKTAIALTVLAFVATQGVFSAGHQGHMFLANRALAKATAGAATAVGAAAAAGMDGGAVAASARIPAHVAAARALTAALVPGAVIGRRPAEIARDAATAVDAAAADEAVRALTEAAVDNAAIALRAKAVVAAQDQIAAQTDAASAARPRSWISFRAWA